MIRIKTLPFQASRLFSVLLVSFLFSSCATLSHIDRAQDEFNKGAEIENAAFLNESISLASPPPPADYYYKRAYAEINSALSNEAKLKKLDIYVNASTMKALCEWKLKNYSEALKTAKVATDYMEANNITADNLPRDFAILRAMRALIGIEEMNDLQYRFFKAPATSTERGLSEYKRLIHNEAGAVRNIEKCLADLESVSKHISEKHDVQTYLLMSKLAALKVWSDALNATRKVLKKNGDFNGDNRDWYDTEKQALDDTVSRYANQLEDQIGKDHSIYKHWNFLLGFQ